jgi:hypothetical protein
MNRQGQTVGIIASGPSATPGEAMRLRCRVPGLIVVNESWRLCPLADVLYAADAAFWTHRTPPPEEFAGERWTQNMGWGKLTPPPGVQVIPSTPGAGMPTAHPPNIHQGGNSGFQALQLALLWGAQKIVLIGFDFCHHGHKRRWHSDYPEPLRNPEAGVLKGYATPFATIAPQIAASGVDVVNVSPLSILKCFRKATLEEALK